MTKITKNLLLLTLVGVLAGCKLAVLVPTGGDVTSQSGTRNCVGGSLCEHNITATTFNESFTALAKPGYVFSKWHAGPGFLCADSVNPKCVVNNTTLPFGNAGIDAVIAGDSFYYVMPLFNFVGIDTDDDGIKDHLDADDDNDGISDLEDECPYDPNPECGINEIGGMISTDTTLFASAGPVTVVGRVQVVPNVTLTIEEGVVITGIPDPSGYPPPQIEVFGSLVILGNSNNPVKINNLSISGKESASQISITHIESDGVSISAQTGALQLRNSFLSSSVWVGPNASESYIEGNVFRAGGFGATHSFGGQPTIYLRNNVFLSGGIYYMNNTYGTSDSFVVKHNSILDTDREVYRHNSNYPQPIDLSENFWGTTDTSVIDTMIYDRNDDLNIPIFVTYLPILTAPHPNTPTDF